MRVIIAATSLGPTTGQRMVPVGRRAAVMAAQESPSAASGRAYRPQERLIVLMLMEAASTGTV
jgi:hypothetical protein